MAVTVTYPLANIYAGFAHHVETSGPRLLLALALRSFVRRLACPPYALFRVAIGLWPEQEAVYLRRSCLGVLSDLRRCGTVARPTPRCPRGILCNTCAHRYSMRVGPSGLLACSRNSHPAAALVEFMLRSGRLWERHDSITPGPGTLPDLLVLDRTHQSAGRVWSAWVYLGHINCRYGRPGCGLEIRDRDGAQCTSSTIHQRNNSWLHGISFSQARSCAAYALPLEWIVFSPWSQSCGGTYELKLRRLG
jgi:hypothetical protein